MVQLNSWFCRFLENHVYAKPEPPPRKRTKPMEVLCVGFPHCATESLQQALLKLGYDYNYHEWDILFEEPNYSRSWVRLCRKKWFGPLAEECTISRTEFDAVLGNAVAVTDPVGSIFAADLIAAYPEAKVVLNYCKDIDAWHDSIKQTAAWYNRSWSLWFISFLSRDAFWSWHCYMRFMSFGLFRALDGNIETSIARSGKRAYHEHTNTIRGLVPKERLLEWKAEDGWEPLCEFLDKPIPNEAFPHSNAATVWQGKEAELTKNYLSQVMRALVVCLAVAVGWRAISQSVCFNCA
ncbi:hypothetical protein GGR54DRAFT_602742 [Hypoxylon sp. NC1633]|nr:hypothetical protein GGR54DRAFT_602742 [Hypoxylon sp. NC1633]